MVLPIGQQQQGKLGLGESQLFVTNVNAARPPDNAAFFLLYTLQGMTPGVRANPLLGAMMAREYLAMHLSIHSCACT